MIKIYIIEFIYMDWYHNYIGFPYPIIPNRFNNNEQKEVAFRYRFWPCWSNEIEKPWYFALGWLPRYIFRFTPRIEEVIFIFLTSSKVIAIQTNPNELFYFLYIPT